MLKGNSEQRRRTVLDATRLPSDAATSIFLEAINDPDALVREWAIEGIIRNKLGTSEAIESLSSSLANDSRADVRWYAARALGKLGVSDPSAVEILTYTLHDSDDFVRMYSAWALGQLRASSPMILQTLRGRLMTLAVKKYSLEAQVIAVALARLNTESRAGYQQLDLFPEEKTEPLVVDKPPTKAEILIGDLSRSAEQIKTDRAGLEPRQITRTGMRTSFVRSLWVKEMAVSQRGPHCQICRFTFRKPNGDHYYECHHIRPLGQGGRDVVENILVVCANCHRQLQHADVTWPYGKSQPREVVINNVRLEVFWPSHG